MKNMRLPLYIAAGVFLITLILGSFFDYQISSAIADKTNTFGLIISVIGPTIGFGGFAFVGGAYIALAIKQEHKLWLKICFFVLAALSYGIMIYYAGREYFGVNGFDNSSLNFAGFIIAAVAGIGCEIAGYFVFKDCQNPRAWIALIFVYVILLFVLVIGINGLKSIMNRPRFRTVSQGNVNYYDWWEKCVYYQNYMDKYGIAREEFKSFPSGHTAEASVLIAASVFAPLAHNKLAKIQLPLFIGSCVFVALVGFARILVGAHYLSDISMGALLMIILTVIANEIAIHIKKLHE